jgi:hypothetical protein
MDCAKGVEKKKYSSTDSICQTTLLYVTRHILQWHRPFNLLLLDLQHDTPAGSSGDQANGERLLQRRGGLHSYVSRNARRKGGFDYDFAMEL